jgi:hypothetical protein
MVRTKVAMVLAGAGWVSALADMLGALDLSTKQSNFCLAAAVTLTAGVMLCVRRRPLGAAYDLGYENGRRDALLTNNSPDGGRLVELHRKVIEPLCDKMSV